MLPLRLHLVILSLEKFVKNIFIPPCMSISFLFRERVTYKIDGVEYSLEPHSFLEIPAGSKHSLHANKDSDLHFVYWGIAIEENK